MYSIEMLGKKFGRLLVISESGYQGKVRMWNCICDCGERRRVAGTGLRRGTNKSCGCSSPRFRSDRISTPNMCGTPTYTTWCGMLHRCSDFSKGKTRKLYYDKGIRVCERWQTFEGFFKDMGSRPIGYSIERIDGEKDYSKENCIWATPKQQANNTSKNRKITVNGITKNVSQWAEYSGLKANTIIYRLRRGWKEEMAIKKDATSLQALKKLSRERLCLICKEKFIPRIYQIRNGNGKYCSQKCNGLSRAWQAKYGTEQELLARVRELLK